MMLGAHKHQLDDRGRFRLPAKFRAQMSGKNVIMGSSRGCLLIMSEEEATRIFDIFEEASLVDEAAQDAITMLYSLSDDAEEDKQGRIILPKKLMDFAGITKHIIIVGARNKCQIWAEELYQPFENLSRDKASQHMQTLAKYQKH